MNYIHSTYQHSIALVVPTLELQFWRPVHKAFHCPKSQVQQVHHCAVQSNQQSAKVPFAFPGYYLKFKGKKNQLYDL